MLPPFTFRVARAGYLAPLPRLDVAFVTLNSKVFYPGFGVFAVVDDDGNFFIGFGSHADAVLVTPGSIVGIHFVDDDPGYIPYPWRDKVSQNVPVLDNPNPDLHLTGYAPLDEEPMTHEDIEKLFETDND